MSFTITIPSDITTDPQAALANIDEQLAPVWVARQKVQALADGVRQIAITVQAMADAIGRVQGAKWQQPIGNIPYGMAAEVTHTGHDWTSTEPLNVWEPGVYGWTDNGPTTGEPPAAPDAEPWSPDAVSYTIKTDTTELSIVTFEGDVYSCRSPHVSQPGWTPTAVPALWTNITP